MKPFNRMIAFWVILFFFLPVQQVSAQHGDYPPLPADAWKGQVSGKVVNQTSGETVAEPVEIMLHAWDPDQQERMMVHGKAGSDGAFRFEEVDFHQDFSYSVMSTYLGASYYSQPGKVEKGQTSLTLDAQVYDTTKDISKVKIDQVHVLFYIEGGQLGVTQFYALSNSGNQTVMDAITLPRDRTGTLKFNLPDEAQNVKFGNDSSGSRYVLLADGFADTAPIPPGEAGSQVVVGFNLPYTGKLKYAYTAPVAVDGVSFLVLDSSGLSLEGKDLIRAGEQALDDGSKFNVYKAPPLKPGETIQLTLSGQAGNETQVGAASIQNSKKQGLAVGAGVLGLALLGAGVWWWRRREENEEENEKRAEGISEESVEGILAEIESLEQAYQLGELSEEDYQEKRTGLRDQLKVAVSPSLQGEWDRDSAPTRLGD